MKKLFAVLCVAALNAAAATPLSPDTTLVEDGPVKVDVRDLDAYLLRVPENMRDAVRTSYDRIASIVDSVFVTRTAAQKAREAGLDKDPAVQRRLQQVQEAFLADLYVQKLRSGADKVDLTARARELYEADPAKFRLPEEVYVQQILIGVQGRTVQMARDRAADVYRQVKDGKEDFLQLAARYTDDPDKTRNGGDLGYYGPEHFPDPVREAIAKLHAKGDIAGPIEAANGFYIVRFVDRKAARVPAFDEVKASIIADERERLRKERVDEFLAKVRGSKSVVTNTANVQAYVKAVDPKTFEQAAQETGKEPAKK